MTKSILCFFILWLLGILCTLGFVVYCFVSYSQVISFINPSFAATYNASFIPRDYFTVNHWYFSKWVAGCWVGLYWALALAAWTHRKPLQAVFLELCLLLRKILGFYRSLSLWHYLSLAGLLVVALAYLLHYTARIPFAVDEVFAYNYFVYPPAWVSVLYYPEPNNHILFNLLASIFDCLVDSPVWAMRLPSILAFLGTLFVLFTYFCVRFDAKCAWFICLGCIVSFSTTIYALQGRGYLLLSFWILLAAFALFEWQRNHRLSFLFLFSFACVAGFYTIPTFLYGFFGLSGLGFQHVLRSANRSYRSAFLKSVVCIFCFCVLLYLPVIGLSGWRALLANRWVTHSYTQFSRMLLVELLETLSFITGVWHQVYWLACGGIVLATGLYFRKNLPLVSKQIIQFAGFQAVGMVFWMSITQVLPPLRVWTYLTFWYPVFLGMVIHTVNFQIKRFDWKNAVWLIVTLTLAYQGYNQYQKQLNAAQGSFSRPFYQQLTRQIQYIVSQAPKAVLVNDHWFQFYLRQQQITHPNTVPQLDTYSPRPNTDYDFIITSPDFAGHSRIIKSISAVNYQIVLELENSIVYQRIRQ